MECFRLKTNPLNRAVSQDNQNCPVYLLMLQLWPSPAGVSVWCWCRVCCRMNALSVYATICHRHLGHIVFSSAPSTGHIQYIEHITTHDRAISTSVDWSIGGIIQLYLGKSCCFDRTCPFHWSSVDQMRIQFGQVISPKYDHHSMRHMSGVLWHW